MAEYFLELPHTNEECLKALDEAALTGYQLLPKLRWGCMAGKHSGWAIVEASSDVDALKLIGSNYLKGTALLTKVDRFTQEQIKSFHKM